MSFYRTYEELKPLYMAGVPFNLTSSFLSYLGGIETSADIAAAWEVAERFYRTYEELKPLTGSQGLPCFVCFYRTYEELKLKRYRRKVAQHAARFYRTYEELKLA